MWDRVESADIDRAKESLGHRLAEALKRHEEEIVSLPTKQADEVQQLETKQTEIETLATLIDRFAVEFQSTTAAYDPPAFDQKEAVTEVSPDAPAEDNAAELETEAATEATPTALGRPEKLALQYASPNFTAFRKRAS